MALHSPLEKTLVNHVEYLTKEEEHEVQTCTKELEGAGEISEGHFAFEELKKRMTKDDRKHKREILRKARHVVRNKREKS